jgi:hypothetical protein
LKCCRSAECASSGIAAQFHAFVAAKQLAAKTNERARRRNLMGAVPPIEIPAPCAVSSPQEFQIEKRH